MRTGRIFQVTQISQGCHSAYQLCMHPEDMYRVGIGKEDGVRVKTRQGQLIAFVRSDSSMKPGIVSLSQEWGTSPGSGQSVQVGWSMREEIEPDERVPSRSKETVEITKLGLTLGQLKSCVEIASFLSAARRGLGSSDINRMIDNVRPEALPSMRKNGQSAELGED